jgi:hypothetical protein
MSLERTATVAKNEKIASRQRHWPGDPETSWNTLCRHRKMAARELQPPAAQRPKRAILPRQPVFNSALTM